MSRLTSSASETMRRWVISCSTEISRRSRRFKIAQIRELIPPGSSVLTIGVESGQGVATANMLERALLDSGCRVVALSYESDFPPDLIAHGAAMVQGDGRALPFRSGSFDISLSNAVIEHVGGPDGATAMVRESQRVSTSRVIHTTPNRWFPFETHTKIPLAHWLPHRFHPRLFGNNRIYPWQPGDRLLSDRDVRKLSSGGQRHKSWPKLWPISLVYEWPGKGTDS